MIGNKLHALLNELNVHQEKTLLQKCKSSNDKTLQLFTKFLVQKDQSLEALNQFLVKEVKKNWPLSKEKEQDLKTRRFASYFANEVENVLLESLLAQKNSIRNLLLAQALEKKGNIQLLNYYYDKGHKNAVEDEDYFYQMIALKGKFRMNYASNNEKNLLKALEANDTFVSVLKHTYEDRLIEYYHNKTNIYLEKNGLIAAEKESIEKEIKDILATQTIPLNKSSLYFSLAKLNYGNPLMHEYLAEGKKMLNLVNERTLEFEAFNRKARFLELRLNFFDGKDNTSLIELADEILHQNDSFTVLNNHTLFYKILFIILDGQLDKAGQLLEENHTYFRGQSKLLEEFLFAIYYEMSGEHKKAIQLLNELMYVSNYFFAVFSRLLFIHLQIKRNNHILIKSIVDSTYRLLTQQGDSPLGQEAHLYTLLMLKEKYAQRKSRIKMEKPKLTVLHQYLLSS